MGEGVYKSVWKYADQIGKHNLMVLDRYRNNSFYLSFSNAKEMHLVYMRPAFHCLVDMYKMTCPLIKKSSRVSLDKKISSTRVDMELYLSKLTKSGKPDYSILTKFDELERLILDEMQTAGILYASEKFTSKEDRITQAYGTKRTRGVK